jgi:hypothetical protein
MASSSIRKQCADHDGCKQAAVTNCEGCSKAFCIKHFTNHRRLLDEEMNVIIDEHDLLKNSINQQITKPDSHSLIKEIDQWETESIVKIQQRAKELRQELLQSTTIYTNDLSKKLQQLSEKLKESRENDNFIETDLQVWKKTLADLKANLTSPSTISINRCDNISFVQNISISLFKVTNDFFKYLSDNAVKIMNDGQVAVRDDSRNCTEVRGKKGYMKGRHNVRLCIEQLTGEWMFLGINSKATPLRSYSHLAESAYGWSSNNYIWMAGTDILNKLNSSFKMKMNDTITLIFDCDNRRICIINERTNAKHELAVDINNCPFPWQLHLVLYEPNTRARILPT